MTSNDGRPLLSQCKMVGSSTRCPRDSRPVLPVTLRGHTLVFRAGLNIKMAPDSELFGDRTETLSVPHDAPQAIHVLSDHHGIRSVASFRRGSSVHFFINRSCANRYLKISHSRVPLRLPLLTVRVLAPPRFPLLCPESAAAAPRA